MIFSTSTRVSPVTAQQAVQWGLNGLLITGIDQCQKKIIFTEKKTKDDWTAGRLWFVRGRSQVQLASAGDQKGQTMADW